jgi:hypothetical protein
MRAKSKMIINDNKKKYENQNFINVKQKIYNLT